MCVMYLLLSMYSEQSQGKAKDVFDIFEKKIVFTFNVYSEFVTFS